MKRDILYPCPFPMVRIQLEPGESDKSEAGAMVTCTPTIDVESKMEGGLLKALSRKVLTGEQLFLQTLRGIRGPGKVIVDKARQDRVG